MADKELHEKKYRILCNSINKTDEKLVKDVSDWVKILEVGAEGGSITIYGGKDRDGEWWFRRHVNETAMYDLLNDEDRNGLVFASDSVSAMGWEGALKLLSRYPWTMLYPLYVHPEFSEEVMFEVKATAGKDDGWPTDSDNWARVCSGKCGR